MTNDQIGMLLTCGFAWCIFGFCLALRSLEEHIRNYTGKNYLFIFLGGPVTYIYFICKLLFYLGGGSEF